MACVRIQRHFEHQPMVYAVPAACFRIPYLPHGSVSPHFRQRTCQPGALCSGFIIISSSNAHIEGSGDPSAGRRIPSDVLFALIFLFMSLKTRSSSACDAESPAAFPRSNPFVCADQRIWFVWHAGCSGYRGKTWMPETMPFWYPSR